MANNKNINLWNFEFCPIWWLEEMQEDYPNPQALVDIWWPSGTEGIWDQGFDLVKEGEKEHPEYKRITLAEAVKLADIAGFIIFEGIGMRE